VDGSKLSAATGAERAGAERIGQVRRHRSVVVVAVGVPGLRIVGPRGQCMDVSAVAVTGASGSFGQRLLPLLVGHPTSRVSSRSTMREPGWRSRNLEFQRVDIAGTDLKPLLEGIDTVVHLAGVVDPIADEALMARINVEGTTPCARRAAAVGATRIVRISSSTVYGAWPNNPVPLTKEASLRPNPHFSPAVQGAEVERLIAEWRRTTIRASRSRPPVRPRRGPGRRARLPARICSDGRRCGCAAPRCRCRSCTSTTSPPHWRWSRPRDLPGVYNVAADGWLDASAARALLPRTRVPAVPAEVLERALRRTWALGMETFRPGVVPYLVHPWVIGQRQAERRGLGADPHQRRGGH